MKNYSNLLFREQVGCERIISLYYYKAHNSVVFLQIHLIKNTLNSWTEFSIMKWWILTQMYQNKIHRCNIFGIFLLYSNSIHYTHIVGKVIF